MGLRETLHGKSEPKKPVPPADPNRPHAYTSAGEHWVGHGVPPTRAEGLNPLFVTSSSAQFADRHCVVCRRDRDDLIHAPADD